MVTKLATALLVDKLLEYLAFMILYFPRIGDICVRLWRRSLDKDTTRWNMQGDASIQAPVLKSKNLRWRLER